MGENVFQKQKRIIDKKVLKSVSGYRCIACGAPPPSDPDHVTTRGAGGGDTRDNVWPLCRGCHVLRHKRGIGYMVRSFVSCRSWLRAFNRQDILDKHWGKEAL